MALSEQRVLKSVEVDHAKNCIQVCWLDQILRDDVVISEVPHRRAFSQSEKDDFIAIVHGAEIYLSALGWE